MTRSELMEVYKAEHERYNKTRDIQWRFNLAVWAVLLFSIYASTKGELKFTLRDARLPCIFFTVFYATAVWLLQVSMQVSRKLFVQVMDQLSNDESQQGFQIAFKGEKLLEGLKAWLWFLVQVFTVGLLLLFFMSGLQGS